MIKYYILKQNKISSFSKKLEFFYENYYKIDYKKALMNSLYIVYAVDNGEVVGALRIIGDSLRFMVLVDFWVEESHRNQGIATIILEKTINLLSRKNIDHIYLMVDKKNKWLTSFYKKFGFDDCKKVILMKLN